jgi:non-ribosomal peptide synthetase component E (peptide arylation enzyme)
MVIGEILTVNTANLPEKIALVMGGESLNYREMNEASNRISNALIRGGIGEGLGWPFWRTLRPGPFR